MPTIRNGTTRINIEKGQSVGGWTLEEIVCVSKEASLGTHVFRFSGYGTQLWITNTQWDNSSRSGCFNLTKGDVDTCPEELRIFSYRGTRVVEEGVEAAERHEQEG